MNIFGTSGKRNISKTGFSVLSCSWMSKGNEMRSLALRRRTRISANDDWFNLLYSANGWREAPKTKIWSHFEIIYWQVAHIRIYVADEITKVIESLGLDEVWSVITDNASSMKSAWRILNARYPRVITIGCCSHGTNLLLKDVMKHEWCVQ